MSILERQKLTNIPQLNDELWSIGLTAMRKVMLHETDARIVLGGRIDSYKGIMPGIAEEALLSLKARQPLFLMGGFGGCTHDIVEKLGIITAQGVPRLGWSGLTEFEAFTLTDLNNGLTPEENATLARTPHVDQAVALILRGLQKVTNKKALP